MSPTGNADHWFATILTGLSVGLLSVVLSVSFATLIFTGNLAVHLPTGIAIALLTAMIVGLVVATLSSCPVSIAIPQDRTAPVLALMAGFVAASLPGGTPVTLDTVLAALAVGSGLTGLTLLLLGRFRLGGLIRFIPYPVVGGFLAGTGWLLVMGALRVMLDQPISLWQLDALIAPGAGVHWIPGATLAIVLLVLTRRSQHPLLMPASLAGGLGLFYLALAATATTMSEAQAAGWMLGPFGNARVRLPSLTFWLNADWSIVATQATSLGTIVLLSAVSILLSSSALEIAAEQDIDLNRELAVAGTANLLTGALGGMVGFHSLSLSTLVARTSARSRAVGIIAAAVCGVTLLGGASTLLYVPKMLLGGLLLFLGLSFLFEWLYIGWFRLARSDYAVTFLIVAMVATVGYLQGVGFGILAAAALFAINYSRIDVVKHTLSGVHRQSNVDRPASHGRILRDRGGQVHILKLQGFIFFGTAHRLLNLVRDRVLDGGALPLRFVVLDFRSVSGLDSSAAVSFQRMRRLAQQQAFTLVFTHVSPDVQAQLRREGLGFEADAHCLLFADVDHGIQWCEDQILAAASIDLGESTWPLADQIDNLAPEIEHADAVLRYFERREVPQGERIMRQGTSSDALCFVESGQVTVRLELADGRTVRLRTMGAGTIVGEIGLYLQQPRTASVYAERPCVLHWMTADKLRRMQAEQPDAAAAFHRFMARLLAERLANTNMILEVLLD